MAEFKSALKDLRKANNMTQEELGKKLGVSKQVISNWERGYTTSISPEMMQAIAKVLNTTTEKILGNQKEDFSNYPDNEFDWKYPEVSNRLGNILQKYRQKEGLSVQLFSKVLNITTQTYLGIEVGKYTPSLKLLQKISEVTKYEIDYLTGAIDHTSIPTNRIITINGLSFSENDFESDCHFKARLDELCRDKGINSSNVEKKLGLSKQVYIDICHNRMPTLSELLKISYALGESMDYLIGKTDMKLSSLNGDELNLILNYRECLPLYKENIYQRAKELCLESITERDNSSVAADEHFERTGTDNLGK